MKPRSALLELTIGTHTASRRMGGYRGLIYETIKASRNVQNWTAYSNYFQPGQGKLPKKLMWKYIDGEYEPTIFKEKLKSLAFQIFQ